MFRYRNFKLIGLNFSGIPTMWSYTTDDTIAQVTTAGYFDDPRLDVEPVDIIKVQAADGPYEVQLVGGVASVVSGDFGMLDAALFSSVSDAIDYQRSTGKSVALISGQYEISTTLVLDQDGDKLVIMPNAELVAASGFSGQSMVEVGNYTDTSTQDVYIGGGGRINAAGLVARCITFVAGRFSEVENLRIDGATRRCVNLGSNSAVGVTYEVNMSNIKCMHEQVQNDANSYCIYYEKATDCYLRNFVGVGYRYGVEISANSYSIELAQCHVWGRSVHGAMVAGFRVYGDGTMSQCNADTPFDEIGLGGTLYGYFISGTVIADMLRVFMNTDLATDNRITPVQFDGNTGSVLTTVRVHGGSASTRFQNFVAGDTTNNTLTNKVYSNAANFVTGP